MAVYMGGGPSLMYAADAISAFEEFQEKVLDRFSFLRSSRKPAASAAPALALQEGHGD